MEITVNLIKLCKLFVHSAVERCKASGPRSLRAGNGVSKPDASGGSGLLLIIK